MNTDTGELKDLKDEDRPGFPWGPVDMDQATEKQKREMKVSLRDHRSKLGQLLTARRYRTLRKKGVLR